jgi:hypothetical protein
MNLVGNIVFIPITNQRKHKMKNENNNNKSYNTTEANEIFMSASINKYFIGFLCIKENIFLKYETLKLI